MSTILDSLVAPDDRTAISAHANQARLDLQQVRDMACTTQPEADLVNTVFLYVRERQKDLKSKLDTILAPLETAETAARGLFREAMQYYATCERECRAKLQEMEQRRLEAENLRRLAALAGEATTIAVPEVVNTAVSGGREWTFTVTDPAAVPREFLCVDERKLKDYAKAHKKSEAILAIAGVLFTRTATVRAKAG